MHLKRGDKVVVDGKRRGEVQKGRSIEPGRDFYLILFDDADEAGWFEEYRLEKDGQMRMED